MNRRDRDREQENAAYVVQEWTPVLRAIEAMPEGQAEIGPLVEALYPPPLNPRTGQMDFRTRAAREWFPHFHAVMFVWSDLIRAGLVEVVIPADGVHPDVFVVSEAGRRWLGEHDALTGSGP